MKTTLLYALLLLCTASCCRQPKTSAAAPTQTGPICGGYSDFRTPTADELELFRTVMSTLDGVSYTPEQVTTQVVAGQNYKFICTARTVTATPVTYKAEVVIYKPLPRSGKQPSITTKNRPTPLTDTISNFYIP